jgi:CHAT domain-containing protein
MRRKMVVKAFFLSSMALLFLSGAVLAETREMPGSDRDVLARYEALYDEACKTLVKEQSLGIRDLNKAVEKFQSALQFYTERNDYGRMHAIYNNLAVAHFRAGEPVPALQYLKCAAKATEELSKTGHIETRRHEFVNLVNLGEAHLKLGQYAPAIESLTRAGRLAKDQAENVIPSEARAYALIYLGLVYSELGLYDQALDFYNQAQALTQRPGPVNLLVGQLHMRRGETDAALESSLKGIAEWQTGSSRSDWAWPNDPRFSLDWARDATAHLYLDLGKIDQAEQVLSSSGRCTARGRAYLMRKDYGLAQRFYLELFTSSAQNGIADDLFVACCGLGMAYEGMEDLRKAEKYYEKGMDLIEGLRASLLPSERRNFFEVKVNGVSRFEPSKGLSRVRMKLNEGTGSLESSESTKARAFSDNIAMRSPLGVAGVPQQVLEKEDALVSRVAFLKKELARTDKERQRVRYEDLSKTIKDAEADLKAFVDMLWQEHKVYAAMKYPLPISLKDSAIHASEYVVTFDLVGEGVGVKLIKGRKILDTHFKRWSQEDLEKDVRRFRQSFESLKLREFDAELGASLYNKLLASVMAEVPAGTPIVIIPDGILAVLPFEALVVSGTAAWKQGPKGDYLTGLTYMADRNPISYYQSITALTLVRTMGETRKTGNKLLVVADPVFQLRDERAQGLEKASCTERTGDSVVSLMTTIEDASRGTFAFRRLPATGLLASDLSSLYGDRSDIYTGLHATKGVFLKTVAPKLDEYRWLVFATHGVFSTRIPGLLEPFLALTMVPPGTDGFLKMSDVMSLKMDADVVALTACQTGLGKELSGEGIMSMGRAFQYAGAKSVLMSLWSVAEKSSVLLVESFFRHAKEGKNRLQALRLAREQVRKEGYDHPFFWAPFILVGETH